MGRRDDRPYDGAEQAPVTTLRVVELSRGIASRICGRLLAGLGHEVLICEPPGGDPMRKRAPVDNHGDSFEFAALNADKRSVVADVDTAEGKTDIGDLLERADLLITDLGPTRARNAGLTPKDIRAGWPELVTVSITAFGLDDPRSDHIADSLLAECFGGLASMIGEPDRSPLSLGGEQAAYAAAFAAFFGGMLALRRRRHGGRGDVVDVAMCDVAAYVDWKSDIETSFTSNEPTRTGAKAGLWRIVRAADGWIGVIFQPEQWETLIELVTDGARQGAPERRAGSASDPERWWPVIESWAARLPKKTIYERAQQRGLAFGFSADLEDLHAERQYQSRGFLREAGPCNAYGTLVGPPVRAEQLRWRTGPPPAVGGGRFTTRRRERDSAATQADAGAHTVGAPAPLAGVTVLDLGTITAGAATGRLLADYGATVIKIESASHPDPFRQWPVAGLSPAAYGREVSAMFESNNAGKLSVVLDLKTEADRASLRRLAARADVVIENFTVGVTKRLAADFESLRAVNPRLVYLSLSSQGQDGPDAGRKSYGSTLDLLSGLSSVTGYRDGGPMWSSAEVNYPDQVASLFGAGIVAYCLSNGIRGVHLDVAQRELVSWTLAGRIIEYAANGEPPARTGNRRPGSTPHDVYPCAGENRWVGIACHCDDDRDALAALVAPATLAGKPEQWWWSHESLVDELVTSWSRSRSRDECVRELEQVGVACAPALSAAERAKEPRFRERRTLLGEPPFRRKGFPFRMHGYQPPNPAPAPILGHDQESVLADPRLAAAPQPPACVGRGR